MSEPVFTSALAHLSSGSAPDGLAIDIAEISDRGMIDLRGLTSDAKFMSASKAALGLSLPTNPRTSASKGDVTALWMSTDQWLVTLPRGSEEKALAALREKFGKTFSLSCNVSDARAIIRLEGDGVREVLMKGSSVAFFAEEVKTGWVRRMLFAEIAALCHMKSQAPDCFDLYVFRSYADYALKWLWATAGTRSQVEMFRPQIPPAV